MWPIKHGRHFLHEATVLRPDPVNGEVFLCSGSASALNLPQEEGLWVDNCC